MVNEINNQFNPDYLVTPGEVLEDYLDTLEMTQKELSTRLGLTTKTVNKIINATAPISAKTALGLEYVLGRPAHFWTSLEREYQELKARHEEKVELSKQLKWLDLMPVSELSKKGFITKRKDPFEQLDEVLSFFGISSPNHWSKVWDSYQIAFKKVNKSKNDIYAISAWLRCGEILSRESNCNEYDKSKLLNSLDEMRGLTLEKDPNKFIPKLNKLCFDAGVVLAIVPALKNMGVFGATRWFRNNPLIQLSLHYKNNHALWFTFFHEIGHIIKHGKRDIFLEAKGLDNEKEKEADKFAKDVLIPPSEYKIIANNSYRSLNDIKAFAKSIGIAPGVVVGQLQHDGLMPYTHGNKLKVFYEWTK